NPPLRLSSPAGSRKGALDDPESNFGHKGAARMQKAAIYARVSTPDQHVETQLYQLRELAAHRGYEIVHEYTDIGVSGSKARRPGLDALLCDAHRRRLSIVLFAVFYRFARSVYYLLT